MSYTKKVKIKGQEYWYLFHTIRKGNKFEKKSKYLGKEIPKNIEEIKKEFLEEMKIPKEHISNLIETLTPLERKILPLLKEENLYTALLKKSKLKEVEVMRALQWLENKNIIKLKKQTKEILNLDKNGLLYLKSSLPEKRLRLALDKPLTITEIEEKTNLSKDEINISLGLLKKHNLIKINKKIKRIKKTDKLLELSEDFLKKLPLETKALTNEEKLIYEEFKKRKEIIKETLQKDWEIQLLEIGKELLKKNLRINLIESLTPEIIKNQSYKGKKFRRYDIKINVPKIYQGKRHFVNEAIDYAKRIWLDLGFKEMSGKIINTSFWTFDALFVPQDHPARDLQDSIFLDKKKEIENKKVLEAVKEMHQSGGNTKSKGWQYTWNEEEAKKLLLRTHTTVLSAQTLSKLKSSDLPAKFFAIGRNYRNETVDWSHLFEFDQTEGIVIDKNVNFKNLLGYLKEFFKKMGFEKVRFRPAFFPYTICSVEPEVYHPIKKKWIELGGAGIFRPEVVVPLLGEDIPVLAWGLGLGRIIMDYYSINDIRELYKNDIKQLREIKAWIK